MAGPPTVESAEGLEVTVGGAGFSGTEELTGKLPLPFALMD